MAVFCLSYLTWRFVEQPFRRRNVVNRRVLVCSIAPIAVFLLAFGLTGETGFPQRFPSIDGLKATKSDALQHVDKCFLLNVEIGAYDETFCQQQGTSKLKNILLIGDSHAASIYPGLQELLKTSDVQISTLTAAYCLPLVVHFPPNKSRTATGRCELINKRVSEIVAEGRFDLVVVASNILNWAFKSDPSWTYPGYKEDFLFALTELAKKTKVMVIGPLLIWPGGLPHAVQLESFRLGNQSPEHVERRSNFGLDDALFAADDALSIEVGKIGVKYVSIVQALCGETKCLRIVPSETGEKLISFDNGHLGLEGSRYLAATIIGTEILSTIAQPRRPPPRNSRPSPRSKWLPCP